MTWASTTGSTVAESDVANGYAWDVGNVGANIDIAPSSDPPVAGDGWYGTFGGQHPAASAVSAGLVLPNGETGTGQPATDKLAIICEAVTEILAILRKTPHEGSGYHKIVNGLGKPIHIRIDPPDDK